LIYEQLTACTKAEKTTSATESLIFIRHEFLIFGKHQKH
jgi:hypothetical protein